jgi:transcriptional regulator with XRE-family HTH domain
MSTVQYNGYENQRHVPTEGTLARLARALETPAPELRADGQAIEQSASELKDAFRQKLAQELGVSVGSIHIFVKWD